MARVDVRLRSEKNNPMPTKNGVRTVNVPIMRIADPTARGRTITAIAQRKVNRNTTQRNAYAFPTVLPSTISHEFNGVLINVSQLCRSFSVVTEVEARAANTSKKIDAMTTVNTATCS